MPELEQLCQEFYEELRAGIWGKFPLLPMDVCNEAAKYASDMVLDCLKPHITV